MAACEGILTIVTEPPAIGAASARPRVAPHVRLRAREAVERGSASAVLTSALHRSFRVPRAELVVVRELDGETDVATVAERAGIERAQAEKIIERFARHGFLVGEAKAR